MLPRAPKLLCGGTASKINKFLYGYLDNLSLAPKLRPPEAATELLLCSKTAKEKHCEVVHFDCTNMLLTYIILAILIGSAGSVVLAGLLLLLKEDKLQKTATYLVSLAGGTLLGAAFLGMMPRAIKLLNETTILRVTLIGIMVFFLIEKIILWRTCYNKDCERHQNASAPLILIGDAFHNFIDGIVIASAFLTSVNFGILAAIAVFAHEIPQELADFGILIKNGYSRKKAFTYNMLSGLTAIPAGLLAYWFLDSARQVIPYVLAFSAASFIYIALADLVPQMHKKTAAKDSVIQLALILLGIAIIYFFKHL